ncbi:MAG: chemotaxis protein CheB [Gammaproteobacteria bacterium]|nr:chemotaxis protein CheB [Gammaproteobacteria bacterium]
MPSNTQKKNHSPIELIVIGASWGGLDALSTVLSPLPSDFSVPILVAQHRKRNQLETTLLTDILHERCPLKVIDPEDKEEIEAGHIYISPCDYHMLVEDKGLLALSSEELVNHSRPSIDLLFESAAEAYKKNLLGVILTGANSDGAKGLSHIESMGGRCIVQDPETAEMDTMPLAAIAATQTDEILPLSSITSVLIEIERERNATEGSSISNKNT